MHLGASIKLSQATNDTFGANPTTFDPQLVIRHNSNVLGFIATKHVDDVKVGCEGRELQEFMEDLEKVFGKGGLDITPEIFTNCGVRHTRTETGYEMNQIEYISALKPITNSALTGANADDPAPEPLVRLYLSPLMALAFSLLTRFDFGVYVIALQRHAQTPSILRIRRLNALVRWSQKHPLKLIYQRTHCLCILEVHSDSGFKKEEKEGAAQGRAMRGANFMHLGTLGARPADSRSGDVGVEIVPCHLLDWTSSRLKTVTRSTFTSETQAAVLATDSALALIMTLHEIKCGTLVPRLAMEMKDKNGHVRLQHRPWSRRHESSLSTRRGKSESPGRGGYACPSLVAA